MVRYAVKQSSLSAVLLSVSVCLSWALAPQATEGMYRAFTEGFTGRWAEAVRSGSAGDLCPADIFGPDAAGGAEALQVMLPAVQEL